MNTKNMITRTKKNRTQDGNHWKKGCRMEWALALLLALFVVFLIADVAAVQADDSADESPENYGIALRSLNDGFPMQMPKNLDAWQERREDVRRRILVANGLWPMPEKTPINPVVELGAERDEFNVYRVRLEAYPGFYVTGNLYVPKKDGQEITEPVPGILYTQGHWQDARFYQHPDEQMKAELESGAETFEGGRSQFQSFCVNMTRNGAVVFFYDMLGHSDSVQIDHMPHPRNASTVMRQDGYGSVKAELNLQNTMGLQTYSSIRVLDWFETLPFVDAKRIGMTGASGGGTQTMMLSAIDDRVAVLCPAVMVSTDMQGGCTCENAPYLRLHAGNIDFAAVFAPKPLAMTTADDWTKEMPTKGFPELKALYEIYDQSDNVALFEFPQFPHNYNQPSRESMYGWFNRHFALGIETDEHGRVREKPFELISNHDLTVWTPTRQKPEGDKLEFERKLLAWQATQTREQLAKLVPHDAASSVEFRRVVGGAMQTIVDYENANGENDVTLDFNNTIESTVEAATEQNAQQSIAGKIASALAGKTRFQSGRHVVITITNNGFDESERVVSTKTKGGELIVVPLSLVGQESQQPMAKTPLYTKQGDSDVARAYQYLYTFGYNDPVFVRRVHNIISATEQAGRQYGTSGKPCKISIIALDGAGKWAALAASQLVAKQFNLTQTVTSEPAWQLDSLVIDTAGFRFADVEAVDDPDFLPGGAKYFDLPGMMALCAPVPMLLVDEAKLPEVVAATYKAENAADAISCVSAENQSHDAKIALIADWLGRHFMGQHQ